MKSVLITGANRGIGLALCEKFLDLGFKVYGAVRSLERSAVEFEQFSSKNFHPIIMDVSKEESVKEAYATFIAQKEDNESLYIIINNAAARLDWIPNVSHVSSLDIDIEILDEIYRTNVFSAIIVLRTFMPSLQQGARVVNVASGSGEFWDSNAHKDFQIGYAPTKSALLMTTMKLAAAVKNKGIYVNSVCPGWCRTAMGGEQASTSPDDGASSILKACFLDTCTPPTGKHWRHGIYIPIDMVPPKSFIENCQLLKKEATQMKKKTVYVHIGMPKCASSSIQFFLDRNRNLLESLSFFYAKSTIPGHYGHMGLSKSYNDNLRPQMRSSKENILNLVDEFKKSACENAIISAEGLMYDDLSFIRKQLEDFDVKLVLVLRDPFSFLNSHYKQCVKEGTRPDLFYSNEDFLIRGMIDSHISSFGKNNILCLNYNKLISEKEILQSFLRICGIVNFEKFEYIKKENVTPCDAALNFMYQITFFPIGAVVSSEISKQILSMDLSSFKEFKSSFLPSRRIYEKKAIEELVLYQASLLNDDDWVDFCERQRLFYKSQVYNDLPVEAQRFILDNLHVYHRDLILSFLQIAGDNYKKSEIILPLMKNIPSEYKQMLISLREGFIRENKQRLYFNRKYLDILKNDNAYLSNCSIYKEKIKSCVISVLNNCQDSHRIGLFKRLKRRVILLFFNVKIRKEILFIKKTGLFDFEYYTCQCKEVIKDNAIEHYVCIGAKQGKDPARWFNTLDYAKNNLDVMDSNVNPFYHYCKYGYKEKREFNF